MRVPQLTLCGSFPPPLLFYFSGKERKTHTQSAVITLEVLHVTMEAFVSVLNGLAGHSFTDCAESIFRLFSFISSSTGGFLAPRKRKLAVAKPLLIVFLQCYTICLLELSAVIDDLCITTRLFAFLTRTINLQEARAPGVTTDPDRLGGRKMNLWRMDNIKERRLDIRYDKLRLTGQIYYHYHMK